MRLNHRGIPIVIYNEVIAYSVSNAKTIPKKDVILLFEELSEAYKIPITDLSRLLASNIPIPNKRV